LRQQSLDAAIGWSYDLLTRVEQTLFQLLAVFVHGFVLESAEAIVRSAVEQEIDVVEGLGSLIDKSLIQVQGQGAEHIRYFMLESIREYAWERLRENTDRFAAVRAHAQYFP
jgi:predicted ATPase